MRKLYRCRWNKKVGGVCGGLGVYFNIDPTIVRLLFVVSLFFSFGISLILYLIGWLVIPEGPAKYIQPQGRRLYRSRRDRRLLGVCGGLAAFFRIDSTVVRVVTVILMIITGIFPILISYAIGAFIIPEER